MGWRVTVGWGKSWGALIAPIQNWWLPVGLLVASFWGALHCHMGTFLCMEGISPHPPCPSSSLGWTARPRCRLGIGLDCSLLQRRWSCHPSCAVNSTLCNPTPVNCFHTFTTPCLPLLPSALRQQLGLEGPQDAGGGGRDLSTPWDRNHGRWGGPRSAASLPCALVFPLGTLVVWKRGCNYSGRAGDTKVSRAYPRCVPCGT